MAPTPRHRCLGLLALLLRICTAAGPNSVSGPSGPATGLGPDFSAPDPTRAKAPLPAPDDMSTQHMKKHGYPGEAHRVITPDGYILTLDRIPHRENSTSDRMPLILLHGMVGNAMQYLIAGPRSGLGYICADAGFDVWLVNYRGTMLSREHVNKLKPKEYWDFSFTEHGIYDTLTAIDYVLEQTNKPRVHILGYSMGASAILIGVTERPEYNEKIQSAILMAPTTSMQHASTPLKLIAPYVNSIQRYLQELHFYFMPMFNLDILRVFNRRICTLPNFGASLCRQFLSVFEGFQIPFKTSLMHKLYDIYPDYFSSKTVLHYFQHLKSGKYCKYDYGSQKNLQIYNSTSPPEFDLSKVNTSIMIVCSKTDGFSSIVDNYWLKSRLPRDITLHEVRTPSIFGHLSFTLDTKIDTLVYKHIVKFLYDTS
nr:PREDICTED: lipase 3-like [Bemisia tabaci]